MKRLGEPPPAGARVYRFQLPPLLALVALVPLALFMVSMLAVILAGGLAAAIILPLLLRRSRPTTDDNPTIELRREDYHTVDHHRRDP